MKISHTQHQDFSSVSCHTGHHPSNFFLKNIFIWIRRLQVFIWPFHTPVFFVVAVPLFSPSLTPPLTLSSSINPPLYFDFYLCSAIFLPKVLFLLPLLDFFLVSWLSQVFQVKHTYTQKNRIEARILNEKEHVASVFLGLGYLTQYSCPLWFHPFT